MCFELIYATLQCQIYLSCRIHICWFMKTLYDILHIITLILKIEQHISFSESKCLLSDLPSVTNATLSSTSVIQYDVSGDQFLPYEGQATYRCDVGHELTTQETQIQLTCLEYDVWSVPSELQCQGKSFTYIR